MNKAYSPREFGALISRTTQTLQHWDREGILKAHRSPTKRRYYTHDRYLEVIGQKAKARKVVTYYRVSRAGQKSDRVSQREAMEQFCLAVGRAIDGKREGVGSGLNYKRRKYQEVSKEDDGTGVGPCGRLSAPRCR
jgi:Predicted site-specific integrase-resolvase